MAQTSHHTIENVTIQSGAKVTPHSRKRNYTVWRKSYPTPDRT